MLNVTPQMRKVMPLGCTALWAMCAAVPSFAQDIAVGVVRADRSAQMTAPLTAVILEMPVKLGDHIAQGDMIARFECTEAEGALGISIAEAAETELELRIQQDAKKYGRGSRADLSRAQVKHDLAKARIKADQSIVDKCTVFAPFSGQITDIFAVEYERQQLGDPMVRVTDTSKAYVEIRMPALRLNNVELGQKLIFVPEQRQDTFDLRIARVGKLIDEVSQTIKVEADIIGDAQNVWIGESGTVLTPEQQ